MERDTPKEAATGAQSDENATDGTVDHQRLARLFARSEPVGSGSSLESPVLAPGILEARQNKLSLAKLLAAAGVGFLILVVGSWYWLLKSRPSTEFSTPPTSNSGGNGTSQSGQYPSNISGKAELIEVPGGTFQMGRSDGPIQEGPPHSVTVGSFAMK